MPPRDPLSGGDPRFDDDLLGLDPDDPEVQAFVAHRNRMERSHPGFTVEGYLADVSEFADSANRAGGERRLAAVVIVSLLLLAAALVIWQALLFTVTTFLP